MLEGGALDEKGGVLDEEGGVLEEERGVLEEEGGVLDEVCGTLGGVGRGFLVISALKAEVSAVPPLISVGVGCVPPPLISVGVGCGAALSAS